MTGQPVQLGKAKYGSNAFAAHVHMLLGGAGCLGAVICPARDEQVSHLPEYGDKKSIFPKQFPSGRPVFRKRQPARKNFNGLLHGRNVIHEGESSANGPQKPSYVGGCGKLMGESGVGG
jgi:hypothetical protein